jgi:hypothetical protein
MALEKVRIRVSTGSTVRGILYEGRFYGDGQELELFRETANLIAATGRAVILAAEPSGKVEAATEEAPERAARTGRATRSG